jgi:hypothetical protein
MKAHKVIPSEFEDELCTEIARRELISVGIDSNILKELVELIVIDTQIEEAMRILTNSHLMT